MICVHLKNPESCSPSIFLRVHAGLLRRVFEKNDRVLFPIFSCGCLMGAVKPPVVPCIHGACEDKYGECDALSGCAEDEDGGDGVHDGVFPFVMFFVRDV